mgnify:CR=1 FL=1
MFNYSKDALYGPHAKNNAAVRGIFSLYEWL